MDPDALVTLGSYPNAVDAHIDRGTLENAGIEAFVLNENSGYAQVIMSYELQVRAGDLEAARAVLGERE